MIVATELQEIYRTHRLFGRLTLGVNIVRILLSFVLMMMGAILIFIYVMIVNLNTKIMPDIKKCKNVMCGKLIYPHQPAWKNNYCDDDCRQEAIHWRSKNEPRLRRRGRFSEIITHYPHKD